MELFNELNILHMLLLFGVGIAAAAINAIAGGGTFFTFPILIFFGLPPTLANTTNKFCIWVGSASSIGGYWNEVKAHRHRLLLLSVIAAIGSIAGSHLLLAIAAELFEAMVPWLMLAATLVFALGRRLLDFIAARIPTHPAFSRAGRIAGWIGQFLVGIYGGFFGAGIGIFLMALYELMGIRNIHSMNGLKVLIATVINTVSTITFLIAGAIIWWAAIPLGMGALLGGYFGAVFTKRLPQRFVRWFIIGYGLFVSVYFWLE